MPLAKLMTKYLAIERRNEGPQILREKTYDFPLALVDVKNEWIWVPVDREGRRRISRIHFITQGPKEEAQVVVFQAIAHEQDRPALHPKAHGLRNGVRGFVAIGHSLNECNVVLV